MVLRIAELNSGPGSSTVYSGIEVPEDKTARAGDTLMSWSGSLGVYRWFRDEAIINQHIFKVIPTGYPSWLVFDRLNHVMPVFQGIAQDKATTMGHIQRGHLESTTIKVPSPEDVKRLDAALDPLWQRLLLAERENVRLEILRDGLLPELLTGRIRVPEAEGVRVA
jgi:type I restriction enzyme S subunit